MNDDTRRRMLKLATISSLLAALPRPSTASASQPARETVAALLDRRIEAEHMAFRHDLEAAFARAFSNSRRLVLRTLHFSSRIGTGDIAAAFGDPDVAMCLTVGEGATKAAAAALPGIPIIFDITDDPVLAGIDVLVHSPPRRVTGFTSHAPTHRKRWEIVIEAFPDIRRLAVFVDRRWPHLDSVRADAELLSIEGRRIDVIGLDAQRDVTAQMAAHLGSKRDAIDIPHTLITSAHADKVIEFINGLGIPSIFDGTHYVRWGALMSYEADPLPEAETLVEYMKLIVRGIPPHLIPVRSPSSFTLALNLKTAARANLRFTKAMLKRANMILDKSGERLR